MASAPSTAGAATNDRSDQHSAIADAKLVRFQPEDAPRIASSVDSAQTLHHVAPNTPPPITAAKVVAWSQLARHAFVLKGVRFRCSEPRTSVRADTRNDQNPTRYGGSETAAVTPTIDGPVAYGELNEMKHRADHFWLGHIVTDPAHRGRGFGTMLVRLLIDHAMHVESATKVSLIVFPDNTAAIRCYRRAGLRCMGAEYHQFGESNQRHKMLRFEARGNLRA